MKSLLFGAFALLVSNLSASAQTTGWFVGESEAMNSLTVSAPYRSDTMVLFKQKYGWGSAEFQEGIKVDYWEQNATNRVSKRDAFVAPLYIENGTLFLNTFRWRVTTNGMLRITPTFHVDSVCENAILLANPLHNWPNERVYPLHTSVVAASGKKVVRFKVFGVGGYVSLDRKRNDSPEISHWEENVGSVQQGQSLVIIIDDKIEPQGILGLGGDFSGAFSVLQVSVNELRPTAALPTVNQLEVKDY